MESQQQMNQFSQVPVSNTAPEQNQPLAQNTKTNQKNKYIIVIIFLAVAAVAGLGFGIYEFWQNSQKDEEVKSLQAENSDLKEQEAIILTEQSEAIATKNPIIAAETPMQYNLYMQTGTSFNSRSLAISIRNGEVVGCSIFKENSYEGDCVISGISGKIYKVAEVGEGQDATGDSVAFIMENGEVEYFSLDEATENLNFNIKGKMNTGGFVRDIITINVGEEGAPTSGYGSAIFVFEDGSYKKYDESMLQ